AGDTPAAAGAHSVAQAAGVAAARVRGRRRLPAFARGPTPVSSWSGPATGADVLVAAGGASPWGRPSRRRCASRYVGTGAATRRCQPVGRRVPATRTAGSPARAAAPRRARGGRAGGR